MSFGSYFPAGVWPAAVWRRPNAYATSGSVRRLRERAEERQSEDTSRTSPLSHQVGKYVSIFLGCFLDDLGRKPGRRRSFIPVERFQVVAHELFVEAWRIFARNVDIRRPETGGVWCKALVDQDDFAVAKPELEFGVCDDDVPGGSVEAAFTVKGQAEVAHDRCLLGPENIAAFWPGDIFIMTGGCFGCRREDRHG